jgi:hypothetical protein
MLIIANDRDMSFFYISVNSRYLKAKFPDTKINKKIFQS